MKRRRGDARRRQQVARQAAQIMVYEGVKQYFDAKRIAARRVLGRDARGAAFRPADLPSNGEIRDAVRDLVALDEGTARVERLFHLRMTALHTMQALAGYHPRLIGSVWSGHARRGSDIDLHAFTDDDDRLEAELRQAGRTVRREEVPIRTSTGIRTYVHLHLDDEAFPVELSVYPLRERRETTRSSTDGKPIDRVSAARLQARIEAEHPERWRRWQEQGPWPFDEPEPRRFGGLLEPSGSDPR